MEALATVSELEIPFKRLREEFLKLHPGRYRSVDQLNFISPSVSELMSMDILADKGMARVPATCTASRIRSCGATCG